MATEKVLWPGWETVRVIGRGSFGTVYEIQRDLLGVREKAALKRITIPQNEGDLDELYADGYDSDSITSTFRNYLKNIISEYTMMRKMNGCTNIVGCDDIRYVQHDNGIGWDIFIKMELLTPLLKALPPKFSQEAVLKLGTDLCTALELCREYNIVHRDIKPQNIFVSPLGDYKLGDFGIAKTVEKTSGGTKIGTYKYMAPEVYHNQPYGSSSDIYSLGLVLYWMLNERRMPFLPLPPQKLDADMEEKARSRRLAGEALPPPAHGSKELKRIVLKACAFHPAQRFLSATEMKQALLALAKPAPGVKISAPVQPEEDSTLLMPPEEGTAVMPPEEGTMLMPPDEGTALLPPENEETAVVPDVPEPPRPAEPARPQPPKTPRKPAQPKPQQPKPQQPKPRQPQQPYAPKPQQPYSPKPQEKPKKKVSKLAVIGLILVLLTLIVQLIPLDPPSSGSSQPYNPLPNNSVCVLMVDEVNATPELKVKTRHSSPLSTVHIIAPVDLTKFDLTWSDNLTVEAVTGNLIVSVVEGAESGHAFVKGDKTNSDLHFEVLMTIDAGD